MALITRPERRVLSLAIHSGHVGYAVMEDASALLAWGTLVWGQGEQDQIFDRLCALIQANLPTNLVMEACAHPTFLKGERALGLIQRMNAWAKSENYPVEEVTRPDLYSDLGAPPDATKYDLSLILANQFVELERDLPPERRKWESEDRRFAFFIAVAMALRSLNHSDPA